MEKCAKPSSNISVAYRFGSTWLPVIWNRAHRSWVFFSSPICCVAVVCRGGVYCDLGSTKDWESKRKLVGREVLPNCPVRDLSQTVNSKFHDFSWYFYLSVSLAILSGSVGCKRSGPYWLCLQRSRKDSHILSLNMLFFMIIHLASGDRIHFGCFVLTLKQ